MKNEIRKGSTEMELRSFTGKMELREATEGSTTPAVIFGYAAVFDAPSTGLGWFTETIERGAFDNTDFSNCIGLFNHDENLILGSVKRNSVRVGIDEVGLWYEIDVPANDYIRSIVLDPMRRGDIDSSSFRFQLDDSDPTAQEWFWNETDYTAIRKIHKIASVLDVSPVLFPAYDAASSSVRKAGEVKELRQQAEQAGSRAKNALSIDLYM